VLALHHLAGRADRVTYPLHGSHTADGKRRAIHHPRIQLGLTVGVEKSSYADVEVRVIFHHQNSLFHSVKGRTAGL
jgi:hypothetical protein